MKKILIIGSGGREHALAWKCAQSPYVEKIYVAPGNGGTATELKTENIFIKSTDIHALAEFAQTHAIDLTLVGPETPLSAGIVDLFKEKNLLIFGPTQAAAMLESSKKFAKEFMQRNNIPTAPYATFIDAQQAKEYVFEQTKPLVIKADGLAAGKGVVIAHTDEQAYATIDDMLSHKRFGDAGGSIIIEKFLTGQEVSFIVMSDGTHSAPLATSQDHKAIFNGDKGPNTGGMGAYSPAPSVTTELHTRIMQEIITPTINGMAQEGNPYSGFLYAGLMITAEGDPKVLEFNCRLGDPEAQPLMMRLESDFIELCYAALNKKLDTFTPQWTNKHALGVVIAAGGYPGDYAKGDIIEGLEKISDKQCKVFHAGTKKIIDHYLTNGGRILCVTTLGVTLEEAQKRTYEYITNIHFNNMYYRTDIGNKATTYSSVAQDQNHYQMHT